MTASGPANPRSEHRAQSGFARYLDEIGLKKGDRLLLWGENRPEWVVAFWGSLARGVQVVPVDFRSSYRLVERTQKEVGAKLLVHSSTVGWEHLEMPRTPFHEIECLGETDDLEIAEIHSDDVGEILYTSGRKDASRAPPAPERQPAFIS